MREGEGGKGEGRVAVRIFSCVDLEGNKCVSKLNR